MKHVFRVSIYVLTHFWYIPNHLVEFYQGSAAAC